MAHVLTTGSQLRCPHGGKVQLTAGRRQLTVDGKATLAKVDVTGKPISGCSTPASNTTKPCTTVVSVLAGESALLSVDGLNLLTANAQGLTDGVAGGPVRWNVTSAGHTKLEA